MEKEIERANVKNEIMNRARANMEEAQKEYFLREELKAINEELGDKSGVGEEINGYREKMKKLNMPQYAVDKLEKEFERLKRSQQGAQEGSVIRDYIDNVLSLPWGIYSKESKDLKKAERILNKDHYGLEKVKERIVEFLDKKLDDVDRLIGNVQTQIEKLKAYKQSLITEVVTKGLDSTVPMKNSGVEWIGEIPEKWSVVPLKSKFSFGKGLPITKDDLVEEGIPVISYGQIHAKWNTGVTTHENLLRYVNESYLESNSSALVKKGDLIMADTSEDRDGCGNCAYIDIDETVFAGYHTIILNALNSENNKYFAYLFLTDNWRSQIRKAVSGVKLFSISRRILGCVSVLVPNNAENIVNYLDAKCAYIDRLIAIKQAKIEKLEQYKRSLIYEYVTGKKEVS